MRELNQQLLDTEGQLRTTVWVVDDSPLEREVVSKFLRREHDVSLFDDGPAVIERIAAGVQPDVLVLDWRMPSMSGLEVCRFLRHSRDPASLPILLLTASAGDEDVVAALEAGANDFVVKSASPAELIARVGLLAKSKVLHDALRRSGLTAAKALEAADAANRANEVFLGVVSHELRTPLNSILGWAQLLADEQLDHATQRTAVDAIRRSARAQVRLIEDILDTTRIVTGKLHLESAPIDFARVVRDAIDATKPAAAAKGQTVEVAFQGQAFKVNGDYGRLQQAASNILTNAIKFTPERGSIRVELSAAAHHWILSVTDTGRGIETELLPFIFDAFRQRDNTSSREHSGLGLGLALVRYIVEAHGGTVGAASLGAGRGATVTITLPHEATPRSPSSTSLYPAAPVDLISPLAAADRLARLNVLVIEDDDDSRALLATVLSRLGATVTEADSADPALELIKRQTPDILVSDIGLPGRDGHQLIRAIRDLGHTAANLPAVALTAYARAEDRARALEAGFQDYVSKPVDIGALIRAIDRLTAKAKAARR